MLRQHSKRTLALAIALVPASLGAMRDERPLELTVTYEGAGSVDEAHRIWVFLWSEPDFTGMPVAMESLAENGGTLTIAGLPSEVFITCVYDARGGYDPSRAAGPPPNDSPRGAYRGKAPGSALAPVALTPGEVTSIELRFGGDPGTTSPTAWLTPGRQSPRSAAIGSTRAARRAGT